MPSLLSLSVRPPALAMSGRGRGLLGVAASRPLPPPSAFNRLRRRGALAYMGGQRPTPAFPPQPPMTAAAFRASFGVGPEDVGRINFKGQGMNLEMAQLTALAAIALLFGDDASDPPAASNQPPIRPRARSWIPAHPISPASHPRPTRRLLPNKPTGGFTGSLRLSHPILRSLSLSFSPNNP